jgi:hypothetical protein
MMYKGKLNTKVHLTKSKLEVIDDVKLYSCKVIFVLFK